MAVAKADPDDFFRFHPWMGAVDTCEWFWRRLAWGYGHRSRVRDAIATLVGIFLIPICNVFGQGLAGLGKNQ